MTPPPPPGPDRYPGQPYPGQPYPGPGQYPAPYGPPPGGPRRSGGRTAVIIAVVAAVALLLCIGGVVVTALLVARQGEDDNPPTARSSAPPPASASAAPGGQPDCRPTASDNPARKAVGQPNFAAAARTGQVTMTVTTNLGQLTIAMDRARTPCTVASMEHLAAKRFYDGTTCHRLVTEGIFALQCGDPTGDGTGGPDYQFADEDLSGARYVRGVVAMANAGPDTNGSQFFIVFDTSPLQAQYTVFGEVRAGMEIVDRVVAAGHDDSLAQSAGGGRPRTALTFQSVTVA